MRGTPNTPETKLARLIIAHQIMAENASCSAGAAGYKSPDNPNGECPIKHRAINVEMNFLINEYESTYGEWTFDRMEQAFIAYDLQREFYALERERLEP
tara:strand:- start:263 stop:559 length:297 start_codon:yes stop_codon:yes gene_type:complete